MKNFINIFFILVGINFLIKIDGGYNWCFESDRIAYPVESIWLQWKIFEVSSFWFEICLSVMQFRTASK